MTGCIVMLDFVLRILVVPIVCFPHIHNTKRFKMASYFNTCHISGNVQFYCELNLIMIAVYW